MCEWFGETYSQQLHNRFGTSVFQRVKILLFSAMAVLLLCSCAAEEEELENPLPVYYVSNEETKVEAHDFEMPKGDVEDQLLDLIDLLGTIPSKLEYKAPFSMGFELRNWNYDDGMLVLDMSAEYQNIKSTTEVLIRAAIVQTLIQLPEIRYISFTVSGEPLLDAIGQQVGWMDSNTFIYNDGNDINTFDQVRIKLYFASEDGTHLIGAYREKFYSTSIPLERFVVDELIVGPSGRIAGLHPTIVPETKVLGVTTKDGICYVNLDSNFLTVMNNVSTETAVYSIVNSLTELSSVNKVQILINGEVPNNFSSTYGKNYDILTTLEE